MVNLPILNVEEALFRANVYQLLPEYASEQYAGLYQQVIRTQELAQHQYRQHRAEDIDLIMPRLASWIEAMQVRPGIIATYHSGSYRLLNLCLLRAGIPLVLIVSKDVALREQQLMLQRVRDMQGQTPHSPQLILLEAEDPLVLRKVVRLIGQGYHLSIYVDGNTGVTDPAKARMLAVPFLSGQLRVRQGIGAISYLANVPIYPVISRVEQGNSRFAFAPPVLRAPNTGREEYVQAATRTLYDFLATHVYQYPGQWECWHYLHPWIVRDSPVISAPGIPAGDEPSSDTGRWQVFRQHQQLYLLDASHYEAYQMNR